MNKDLKFNYEKISKIVSNKIKNGKKVNVLFFVIHSSVWQYEMLYQRFYFDNIFDPIIVVIPYIMYDKKVMINDMNQTYQYFKNKKYNVIKTYDEINDSYLDVKKELKPDVIFFTNPHKITKDEYYIFNYYQECLTCYVPYGIMTANLQDSQYNQPFHNLVWKNFYETSIHYEIAQKYAENKGENVVVTGYPKCDVFLNTSYKPLNVWKNTGKNLKKIIWAPHHTLKDNNKELGYSNFLKYHQIMLDIAQKYKNKIQFAFKPHPILLTKLILRPDWGEKKVSEYCEKWENGPNTQVNLEDYIDLFIGSDAIILDSISFITEYMFVNKPRLFMIRDLSVKNKFNEFGKKVFSTTYKSYNEEGVIHFIENVILQGKDTRKKTREQFIQKYLIPPNNRFATDNIYNYILDYLQ